MIPNAIQQWALDFYGIHPTANKILSHNLVVHLQTASKILAFFLKKKQTIYS